MRLWKVLAVTGLSLSLASVLLLSVTDRIEKRVLRRYRPAQTKGERATVKWLGTTAWLSLAVGVGLQLAAVVLA